MKKALLLAGGILLVCLFVVTLAANLAENNRSSLASGNDSSSIVGAWLSTNGSEKLNFWENRNRFGLVWSDVGAVQNGKGTWKKSGRKIRVDYILTQKVVGVSDSGPVKLDRTFEFISNDAIRDEAGNVYKRVK